MRRCSVLLWLIALAVAPYLGLGQTTWTWQGSCNTQGWYDTCTIGRCGSGNNYNLLQNNWGQVRCSSEGSPAFPGANDTVIIPSGYTVRINGDVTVARIEVQEGATLIWQSGDLIVGELVNLGVLEWANRSGGTMTRFVGVWSIVGCGARRRVRGWSWRTRLWSTKRAGCWSWWRGVCIATLAPPLCKTAGLSRRCRLTAWRCRDDDYRQRACAGGGRGAAVGVGLLWRTRRCRWRRG
jgi:hypothetical protein